LFFKYSYESKQLGCGTKSIESSYGTKNLSPKAKEGRQLFNTTCAACHKIDVKAIGPALRNIDSIHFHKWLNYQNFKIDTTKLDQLGMDYHRSLSKNNFKVSNLENIYEYIKAQ
jgi:cytochrome c peroxidase